MTIIHRIAAGRSTVALFFQWWSRNLTSLMPALFIRAAHRDRGDIILALSRKDSTVLRHTARAESEFGSVATDIPNYDQRLNALLQQAGWSKRTLTIRLPPELGLRRILALPLAALDDLDQLLKFEMDRLTPFQIDDVYYAHRVLEIDRPSQRIIIELHVAPRSAVRWALQTAQPFGAVATRVELGRASDDTWKPLDLCFIEQGVATPAVRLNRVLTALALALTAILLVVPLQRQLSIAAELDAQVAGFRAEAEKSSAQRDRLDQLSKSATFLMAEKTRRPTVIEVLAELTRLLPDEVHLRELKILDGVVQLYGLAEDASHLIGLLEQSGVFGTPRFMSPVTRDSRTGVEAFEISFDLITKKEV